jgi:hypothetical protein
MVEHIEHGQELTRKISVQTFGWTKDVIQEAVIKEKSKDQFLMRVYGTATSLKPYTSKNKGDDGSTLEGYGIIGDFEAIGPAGESVPGSLLYLPGYITDQIGGALASEDDVAVNIALDIYARYDRASATSYVFVARSHIKRDNPRKEALAKLFDGSPIKALTGPDSKSK